jgi:dTDP-4-dehydrorhamnose reductase
MPPKVAVLGAAGMLGHKMFQRLQIAFSGTVGLQRCATSYLGIAPEVVTGVDVTDFDSLSTVLVDIHPDYIVNCVGIIK